MFGGWFGQLTPLTPNDPYYSDNPTFPGGQYWLRLTRTNYAWSIVGYTLGPQSVSTSSHRTIAIIDTGTDPDHPNVIFDPVMIPPHVFYHDSRSVLDGAIAPPFACGCHLEPIPANELEDLLWLGNGLPSGDPHGTVETGLLGAVTDNSGGMAGVCWDCSLLVERVATAQPSDFCDPGDLIGCYIPDDHVALAIKYAAGLDLGLQVYPNSSKRAQIIYIATEKRYMENQWCSFQAPLKRAIEEATARGCIIVTIAGNDATGPLDRGPMTAGLAIHPFTITVGGCDRNGLWSLPISQSNPECTTLCHPECVALYPELSSHIDAYNGLSYVKALSVVAPIEDIFSTYDIHPANNNIACDYIGADGTSWAAPQVAGVVALMLKVNPDLTPEMCKKIIEVTATDLATEGGLYPGYDRFSGYGLLNAEKAVTMAAKLHHPGDWNMDGSVGPLDAVLYAADFGAEEPTSDLVLSESLTGDDLGIFLDSCVVE
ncbi:MAG: S8 family serine peptidase [Phycisphaerales bacterium]|nr:S8 family serine peptidase [Phycisphaerales bacterium]